MFGVFVVPNVVSPLDVFKRVTCIRHRLMVDRTLQPSVLETAEIVPHCTLLAENISKLIPK